MRSPVFRAESGVGRRAAVVLVALALLAILVLAVTVRAEGSGALEGQVVNGTANGPEVGAGITVTLHVNQGDNEANSLETTTDATGRFRFEGLDTDAALEYWPEVVYLAVPYSSAEPTRFDDGQMTLTATITIYETTGDDSTIRLDLVHFIVESFEQVLRISEIQVFGNSGNRTYVGHDGQTVYIPLPEEAVGLAFEEETPGDRFVEVQGGVMDTAPVPPGAETSLVFFSYHVLSAEKTVPLQRSFAYPVADLNMLVAQPGLTLHSDQLQAAGPRSFQGRQYEYYTIQDLPPAAPGTTAPGGGSVSGASPRGNQGLLRWFGVALAGLAVVGAVAYPLAARRIAATPASASAPNLAGNPKAQPLLTELVALEEAFEAGQIDEESYERQRAEKYERLKAV